MNKSGFSLIETIIALLIISVCGVALFKTQGQLFLKTANAHDYFERIFIMKNYFIKANQNKWFSNMQTKAESLKNLEGKITYSSSKPISSAFKDIKNLVKTKVTSEWNVGARNIKRSLVYFKYNLPKPK